MPAVEFAGKTVEVNDEGFLVNAEEWTPEIAQALAAEAGIGELTDAHWKVINFCREDTASKGESPGLRRISKNSGIDMKQLYQLFPKGPGKLAARISGVPKPHGCI